MPKFPLKPIGQVLVVEEISSDMTAGGVVLPGKMVADDYVVGEVIRVGTGNRTITGDPLPNEVAVGDIIVFQKMAARAISFTLRKHLMTRGCTEAQLDKTCIVMHDNVIGILDGEVEKKDDALLADTQVAS